MDKNVFCWVGLKESDILYTNDFFDYAIVIFGSSNNPNHKALNILTNLNIDHNNPKNDDMIGLFNVTHIKELETNPNIKFMFYNPHVALKYYQNIKNTIVCLNSKELIENLESKIKTREYYKNIVPVLPHQILDGKDCDLENLKLLFKTESNFVLQKDSGSGGSGTIVYNGEDIDKNTKYLVTEYHENAIPINTHLLITNDEVIVLPSSIQIIENHDNHLNYKGCDFIGFRNIEPELQIKTKNYAKKIGKDLKKRGYLGVLGIDSIIVDGEVYFIEINPRFQNSSTVLNKSLIENHMMSLQEMNYCCFNNKKINYHYHDVNYSSYTECYGEGNMTFPFEPILILDYNNNLDVIDQSSYEKTIIFDQSLYEYIKKDQTKYVKFSKNYRQ